jgi:hypothetical protein
MKRPTASVIDRRDEIEAPPDIERFSSLRRMATDPGTRFVVSMGGGGVPSLSGNTALAILLEELGLREHVDEVWGTSGGAIVGGSWASGTTAARIREILLALRGRRMLDIDWLHLARGVLLKRFGACFPDAILRGKHFHEAMCSGLKAETFEQCEIPFRCIACTEDEDGRRKVFREGPLAPAISASMSLPGFLLPRDAEGQTCNGFFDGGLVEKTPLFSPLADHTRLGDGRDLLILGAYFGPPHGHLGMAQGFFNRFLVTIDALAASLWEHQQQEARRQSGVTVLMVDPHLEADSTHFNFERIDRDYLHAREAFKDKLQNARIALTLGTSCGPKHPCPA